MYWICAEVVENRQGYRLITLHCVSFNTRAITGGGTTHTCRRAAGAVALWKQGMQ